MHGCRGVMWRVPKRGESSGRLRAAVAAFAKGVSHTAADVDDVLLGALGGAFAGAACPERNPHALIAALGAARDDPANLLGAPG